MVQETDGSGSTLASYLLGGTGLLSQTRDGVTSYYLQDGQGSTRALTDAYDYTAFGELYDQTGATANPYLYTGQQFDSLTGLYSLRARYYNPAVGRFLSQDTYPFDFSNPVELNRYVYTANNPINLVDPGGYSGLAGYVSTLASRLVAARSIVATGMFIGATVGAVIAMLCGGNGLQVAVTGAAIGGSFGVGVALAAHLLMRLESYQVSTI